MGILLKMKHSVSSFKHRGVDRFWKVLGAAFIGGGVY